MGLIELVRVSKRYSKLSRPALRELSLSAGSGEILTLLGPSGCGKTTALRLIAGFETPDEGVVLLSGRAVAGNGSWVPPEKRRIGMMFQDLALFPHLSVSENVSFGFPEKDRLGRSKRLEELLGLVGLAGAGGKYPHQLSGGQRQRVALARVLGARPLAVLLDEPFSNLDAALKLQMRREVERILRAAGQCAVFVTHDQQDALAMSDKVAVVRDGAVEQIGSPRELYEMPRTEFVATFVGKATLIPGRWAGQAERGRILVRTSLGLLECLAPADATGDGQRSMEGRRSPARVSAPAMSAKVGARLEVGAGSRSNAGFGDRGDRASSGSDGELLKVAIRPEDLELDPVGELKGYLAALEYAGWCYEGTLRVTVYDEEAGCAGDGVGSGFQDGAGSGAGNGVGREGDEEGSPGVDYLLDVRLPLGCGLKVGDRASFRIRAGVPALRCRSQRDSE